MYDISRQPESMQRRYGQLPEEIRELFDYETVDVIIHDTTREFGLNEAQKDALQMEIELVLYLFLPRTGFIERLQDSLEIDRGLAEKITAKVETDLFTIVDNILTFVESQFADGQATESAPSAIVVPPQTPSVPTPPPPPEPKQETGLKPLRTFAEDVAFSRAHSYGSFKSPDNNDHDDDTPTYHSSQDDIIKK